MPLIGAHVVGEGDEGEDGGGDGVGEGDGDEGVGEVRRCIGHTAIISISSNEINTRHCWKGGTDAAAICRATSLITIESIAFDSRR